MTERDPIRRAALLATPPLLLMTTAAAFRGFQRQFGDRLGYLAGFLVYWIGWCMLLPLWVLGPRGLRELFRPARHSRKDVALLSAPPALGMVAAFPSAAREATPAVIAGSVAIAVVNGTLEEVLWHGAYQAVFPDAPMTGYLYPAVGFAVWHYAPQMIHPNRRPGGPTTLVATAGLVWLLWGWVRRRTGSVLSLTISHIVFDFSGLGARVYAKPPQHNSGASPSHTGAVLVVR